MRATAVAVALGIGLLQASAAPGASAAPTVIPGETPTPPGPAGKATTISDAIAGFTFVVGWASLNAPGQMVRIRTGDTIEWTNLDPVSHSVAFDAFPKALYLKEPGARASHTFTEPGYYTYRCAEHPEFPGMEGLVFVSDR